MSGQLQRKDAESFVRGLTSLEKVASLYPQGHAAVDRAVQEMARALQRALSAPGPLLVGNADGYLVVGGVPFLDQSPFAQTLLGWLAQKEVEGVVFGEATRPEDASRFCQWLRSASSEPWPGGPITLTRLQRDGALWEKAIGTYRKALNALEDAYQESEEGRIPDPERARDCVGSFSELLDESPAILRCLTLIKDYDRYTLHHSVNVCLHALGLGRHLGLGPSELECLAVGALFHDIGKTRTPPELVRKPTSLSHSEWGVIWRHPEQGRDILGEMKGLPQLTLRLVYEHHMRYDGGGYPTRTADYAPCSLSALVTVADVYDAMTTHRPYSAPLSLPEAVRTITRMRGSHLAPGALDAFLTVVGRTPVGSVVRLATGEVAVVSRLDEGGDVTEVRVVVDASGGRDRSGACSAREVAPAEVIGAADPLAHGIDPVEILRSVA